MKYKYIGVDPLTPAIGALISGVDISTEITQEIVEEIESAFHNHLVLFFEDQKLTPSQLVDFAKRFGKIGYYPFVYGFRTRKLSFKIRNDCFWNDSSDAISGQSSKLNPIVNLRDAMR